MLGIRLIGLFLLLLLLVFFLINRKKKNSEHLRKVTTEEILEKLEFRNGDKDSICLVETSAKEPKNFDEILDQIGFISFFFFDSSFFSLPIFFLILPSLFLFRNS